MVAPALADDQVEAQRDGDADPDELDDREH
jgi:hypothetical protein